jgi:hypothetical protein
MFVSDSQPGMRGTDIDAVLLYCEVSVTKQAVLRGALKTPPIFLDLGMIIG